LFYSSVAGVTVSAAGAAVSVATGAAVSVAAGATFLPPELLFQLHQLLCQNLYQKVLQQLQLLLKIKFID
jgi:hypothetical protein